MACVLSVPKFGADGDDPSEYVNLEPQVVAAKWTKNNHLEADALTLTFAARDAGVDPRLIRSAHVAWFLWDAAEDDFDDTKHLRFVGICTDVERSYGEDNSNVDMTFHDYTALFEECNTLGADAIPDWSNTLTEAWHRICDGTGHYDPETETVVSSVSALRDRLVFRGVSDQPLEGVRPQRFTQLSKPQFTSRASSWKVWQELVSMLGLYSFIEKDQCIVTDVDSLYDETHAPALLYGSNVLTWEERCNTPKAGKGVILVAFDPIRKQVIEAAYPPPGDPRVKMLRGRASKAVTLDPEDPTALNRVTTHYDRFNYPYVSEKHLNARARQVYEERSRQEIEGKLTTAGTMLFHDDRSEGTSIFDLVTSQAISVGLADLSKDLLDSLGGEAEQVQHLMDHGDYSRDAATLIVRNATAMGRVLQPVFNVTSMTVTLNANRFEVDVAYHNKIRV